MTANNSNDDDWVIVTGAASGIGFDVVQSLLDKGHSVVALDHDHERLDQVFDGADTSVVCRCVDVRNADDITTAIPLLHSEFGPIKGLVNCAGVYPVTPFLDITVEEWDDVLNTNLRGAFIVSQAVGRIMVADGIQGSIVNVTSTSATFCRPGVAHYGTRR